MERVCKDCGSMVNGEAKFCPVCGKLMERAVDPDKQRPDVMPQQAIMNAPAVQPGNNMGSSAGYGAPQNIAPTPRNIAPQVQLTTGEWVLTIIVSTFFGLVSLVLNAVWGFSNDTPEPKRTYCRAMFFVSLGTTILGTIVGGYLIYVGVWLGGAF